MNFRPGSTIIHARRAQRRLGTGALRAALVLLPLVSLGGCPGPDRPPVTEEEGGPVGPPRSTNDIVYGVEENVSKLTEALWSSSVSTTARFRDERGKGHSLNLDGTLIFAKPRNFRMDLRPGLGDQVMSIGSNDDAFWVWIEPETGTMSWGHHRNAGRPCCEEMPVRPDQLISALVVAGLPTESEGLYGPVRRFGKTHDILTYHRAHPQQDHREYWVMRKPPYLVEMVIFRDAMGRMVMSAYLDEYEPAWDGGPALPHSVNIIWPTQDAKFTMRVDGYQKKRLEEVSPRAFALPTRRNLPEGVRRIVQVDADCEGGGEGASEEWQEPAVPEPGTGEGEQMPITDDAPADSTPEYDSAEDRERRQSAPNYDSGAAAEDESGQEPPASDDAPEYPEGEDNQ